MEIDPVRVTTALGRVDGLADLDRSRTPLLRSQGMLACTSQQPLRLWEKNVHRTIIEVPVISGALRRMGAPVSPLLRAGSMLYTCGMPPIDPESGELERGDISAQARTVMRALEAALKAGGSSLQNIVKATVYLTNNADTEKVNAVWRNYFPHGFPARTCVAVQRWPSFDIEIECIAVITD